MDTMGFEVLLFGEGEKIIKKTITQISGVYLNPFTWTLCVVLLRTSVDRGVKENHPKFGPLSKYLKRTEIQR